MPLVPSAVQGPTARGRMRRAVALVLAASMGGAWTGWAASARDAFRVVTSVDAATTISEARCRSRDMVSVRVEGGGLTVHRSLGDVLPDGVNVDALSLLGDGTVVFSTDVSFELGELEADDEDLVAYRQGQLSLVFDGSAAGLPDGADLDAAHVVSLAPLDLLYSVAAPVEVGGVVFADDDIIRTDGSSHTIALSGSTFLGNQAPRADVDGLWYDPARGEYAVSLDVAIPAATGRTAASSADVVLWTNGTLVMLFDASARGLDVPGLDLDAIHLELTLFADDFEAGTTGSWSTTSP